MSECLGRSLLSSQKQSLCSASLNSPNVKTTGSYPQINSDSLDMKNVTWFCKIISDHEGRHSLGSIKYRSHQVRFSYAFFFCCRAAANTNEYIKIVQVILEKAEVGDRISGENGVRHLPITSV